jgi:hypothetical protein
MMSYDVFNGDTDGICALHQLRLHVPRPEAHLITGVKRDICLLDKIAAVREARITVLDISMDSNRQSLNSLLEQDNEIFYADHHFSGEIPESLCLESHIDPSPKTCTSLIINRLLKGRHLAWGVVGAFGDNLDETAKQVARPLNLNSDELTKLQEIGILLNYNGYGTELADLFFPPVDLYREVHLYEDPLLFHAQSGTIQTLRQGYKDDMARASGFSPVQENGAGRIYQLPGEAWAHRVAGVFANTLAREKPQLAHGLLMENSDGSLRISVRAPLLNKYGADKLCRMFPSGGGRSGAAGINRLPAEQRQEFMDSFFRIFLPEDK